jgi:hypothetical protein
VVWDREGEEGMRVIQRKGKGREEGKKGREGRGGEGGRKEGRKERRRKMTWPPRYQKKKIPGSATAQLFTILIPHPRSVASAVPPPGIVRIPMPVNRRLALGDVVKKGTQATPVGVVAKTSRLPVEPSSGSIRCTKYR